MSRRASPDPGQGRSQQCSCWCSVGKGTNLGSRRGNTKSGMVYGGQTCISRTDRQFLLVPGASKDDWPLVLSQLRELGRPTAVSAASMLQAPGTEGASGGRFSRGASVCLDSGPKCECLAPKKGIPSLVFISLLGTPWAVEFGLSCGSSAQAAPWRAGLASLAREPRKGEQGSKGSSRHVNCYSPVLLTQDQGLTHDSS